MSILGWLKDRAKSVGRAIGGGLKHVGKAVGFVANKVASGSQWIDDKAKAVGRAVRSIPVVGNQIADAFNASPFGAVANTALNINRNVGDAARTIGRAADKAVALGGLLDDGSNSVEIKRPNRAVQAVMGSTDAGMGGSENRLIQFG